MTSTAQERGWGDPPTPRTKIKTVLLADGVKLPVRKEIAELIKLLCEETVERGYKLRGDECWGYAPRRIRGLEDRNDVGSWSNHAYGLAVDLNAKTNPMTRNGKVKTDMPLWLPALWKEYGFRWGGNYTGKTRDPMHFEFMGKSSDIADYVKKFKDSKMKKFKHPTVKEGDKGEAVAEAQRRLNAHGAHLVVDGVFGPITEGVVRWFQRKHKLTVDGVVGPKTWGALG